MDIAALLRVLTQAPYSLRFRRLRRLDGTPVTVISSSHSLAFFSKFTFAMYLANKTLQEWGTVEELKAKRGLYFQLVAAQEGMSVDDSGRAKLDPAKLRTVWLFAKLKAEQLARLAAMFTSRRVGAGEQLYGAGDVQDTCYIIASGRLELRRPPPKTARGKAVKRTLRTLEPGACCNEECLLRDITPAHDAFADGPVVLLACARVYFDMTLVAVPAIAEAVKDIVARRDEFVTAATLRHAWPLSRLSDAAAAAVISDAFRIDVVPARTVLCEPGAPCAAMHVVLSGTVALTESDGQQRRCCAGAVFGEASLLADVAAEPAEPRLTRAASVEECVVAVLPRDALSTLMEHDAAVRSALREVADAWLAARAPAALARHWLLAPLVAADGAGGSVLRSLSSAVHTRLLARGEQLCTQRSAAPAVCVLGKLLDTWAPSGGGPQLVRELGPGALAAPETLLLSQSCASVAVEAAEASIVACLPRGALAAAAAALPAAAAATAALLAAYQAALTPSAFAALGLADVPPEALVDLAGLCEPRVLRPGEAVFDGGRAAAPWLARVLWGEVATRQGGTAAAGQLLRTDAAAALAPRATTVSSTGDAASAHAGAAPTAVVLLMDVGALVGPAAEARHLRAAKLLAQAAARAAQQERIAHLKRTVSLARMALEGTAAQATRCAGARARCGFRSAARGVQAAVRLRQALAPAGASLEETEAAVRALLAQVDAEVATRRAERQRRCAALRAAWESLEAPAHVPPTAQDALDACRDDVSRAALAALAEALAEADAALAARRAEVAAEEEAVRSLLTLMGPEPPDGASAAALRRLSSAGLQRSVVEELGALRRALDAEQASRLAAQAATRAALTDIRLAMARAGASYDAARLPPAAPTLAAVRAHDAALARATAALAPVLAATRAELEALAEKLRLPPARRARFAPTTPPEAPSGALLTRLLDELAQLREADEIVTNALTGPPEPPPPPPKPAREPSSAAKDREAWLEERRRGWVGAP
jgi:CRP-like cAMP-binding protein